jgi:hypothetical protein
MCVKLPDHAEFHDFSFWRAKRELSWAQPHLAHEQATVSPARVHLGYDGAKSEGRAR